MGPAAQRLFDSQSPEDQAKIRASWGGKDMGDAWYNNAVAAGAAPSAPPRDPNAGAGTAYAAQTGHTQGQSQDVSGSSGLRPGDTPSPAQLRQFAQEQGFSEDYDRFNDATLQSWIANSWNPQTMRFRTEKRDANGNPISGDVEKPVDTPPGWTAWGQGAIPTDEANQKMAGWGGKPAASAGAPGASPAGTPYIDDPLQRRLVELYGSRGGTFAGVGGGAMGKSLASGGIMWSEDPNATGANPFGTAEGPPQTGGIDPYFANAKASGIDPYFANPALVNATLNAFTPKAPSQQGGAPPPAGGYSDPYENAKAGISAPSSITPQWSPSATGGGAPAPAPSPTTPPSAPTQAPLEAAVQRRFSDPTQWWRPRPQLS